MRTVINRGKLRAFLLPLLLSAPLAGAASAQQPIGFRAWVDPVNGNDAAGVVSVTNLPVPGGAFLTLNAAISAVNVRTQVNPLQDGVVFAMPGVYSGNSNGEVLPVDMMPGVHVTSSGGAKETVIRNSGGQVNRRLLFQPNRPQQGGRALRLALVDFTFAVERETVLNGVTLQGGDVQVYCETELNNDYFRVSNSVFDMRLQDTFDTSPYFGVQVVPVWELDIEGYRVLDAKIFNNTFLQDYQRGEAASGNNVAIINVNDPVGLPPGIPDPNLTLRRVVPISVQNNVIRAFGGQRTSMLGVSDLDTQIATGTPGGPTNAFIPGTARQRDLTGSWYSAVSALPLPIPRVALNPVAGGVDPAFLGEFFLTQSSPSGPVDTLDWRRLPALNEPLNDQGSVPDVAGNFRSASGVLYFERPLTIPTPEDRVFNFTFDGEGFGNPRVASLTGGAPLVDIGYDEADLMTMGGSWGENTRSHNFGWSNGAANGNMDMWIVFPPVPAGVAAAGVDIYSTLIPIASGPGAPIEWSARPGYSPTPFFSPLAPGIVWIWTTLASFQQIPVVSPFGLFAPFPTVTDGLGVHIARQPNSHTNPRTGIAFPFSSNQFLNLNFDTLPGVAAHDWNMQAFLTDDGVRVAVSNLVHLVL